jgi:hypothetical protein
MSRSIFEEVPRRWGQFGCVRKLGRSEQTVWLVLEELDEKVRRRLGREFWESGSDSFGIRRKDQKVGFREGR